MKRSSVIFLSFLVLFSSGGLVMAKHFCGGELVEAALFKELHSCCDGMEMPTECCEMEREVIHHDDNTPISFRTLDHPIQVLLYMVEYPSYIESITHTNFERNNYLLRSLTVPDIVFLVLFFK